MIGKVQIFDTSYGHIFDTSSKSPAAIFNEAILPRVQGLADQADPGGLEEAARKRESQLATDLRYDAFREKSDDDFLAQLNQRQQATAPAPVAQEENYNVPAGTPAPVVVPQGNQRIKLSNYGYDSDSSPDYNSNVRRVGNHENHLEDGISAALTKSLAQRHGLKTGDMFEAVTSDGKVLRRRYDDTVPTHYGSKPLPETVDLYELNGSNKFGGSIVQIRPLSQ